MFFLLGISVILAVMLVLNTSAALVAGLVWRLARKRISSWSPARSALALFLLRTLPVAIGAASVVLLFAPAFWIHEPRQGFESISFNLGLMAAISLFGILLAVFRGLAAFRVTGHLAADWLRNAEPISLPKVRIPAYLIERRFPLIAVVGAINPKLFIARQVVESLSAEELSAALDHEAGHITSRDNIKRSLMRLCRDMLLIAPFGRSMDAAWIVASETAADEYAARKGTRKGLDLASAMVKIARMIPAGARPTMAAGAFLVGDEGKIGFKTRVSRLLQISQSHTARTAFNPSIAAILRLAPLGLILLVIGIIASEPEILSQVHGVIEHTVKVLD
jgi:Zn-dependent protease with chaperone function